MKPSPAQARLLAEMRERENNGWLLQWTRETFYTWTRGKTVQPVRPLHHSTLRSCVGRGWVLAEMVRNYRGSEVAVYRWTLTVAGEDLPLPESERTP